MAPVYAVAAPGPGWSGEESGLSFADYLKRATDNLAERRSLGIADDDWQAIQTHERRKGMLGESYHGRDTGSWRNAEEYLKRTGQKQL